jgi:hypothetical protein
MLLVEKALAATNHAFVFCLNACVRASHSRKGTADDKPWFDSIQWTKEILMR